MCLAIPGRITSIGEQFGAPVATVDFDGTVYEVALTLVPEAQVGDYVIAHAGVAIQRLDEVAAVETLAMFREIGKVGPVDETGGARPVRYLDEFNDPVLARGLLDEIGRVTTRPWTLMELCGGQTHSIIRHGIDQLLPEGLELLHGPGCPVCVTPLATIDRALAIAALPEVTFCSFGDMLRVPGSAGDLFTVRSQGGDVRVVHSPLDAVRIAVAEPHRQVVFFAIGFETTAPANALAVRQARQLGLTNFSLLVSHVLVPPAVEAILAAPACRVQAILAAGHVCTVMGLSEYRPLADRHHTPMVITGFEPLDLLDGIRRAVLQLERGVAEVENAYPRAVAEEGNPAARSLLGEVFETCDREWRGIGMIPASGWRLRDRLRGFDAEERFADDIGPITAVEPPECRAGEVLRGLITPAECEMFATVCTPRTPLGATMVSGEGTCAAYYAHRRVEVRPAMSEVHEPVDPTVDPAGWSCPPRVVHRETVVLGHGGGGRLTAELLADVFLPALANPLLDQLADATVVTVGAERLAITTDSFVVQPLFFPGGDIGSLAVHGTVNDLTCAAAVPLHLTAAFVIEEGTDTELLRRIADSMGAAARAAGVAIVAGDTKVVQRGKGDGVYITTTGVGRVRDGVDVRPQRASAGDAIIVTGSIGRHGVAVMSVRDGLQFGTRVESDSAPVHGLAAALFDAGIDVHVLRDPTRGGVAAALNEIASASETGIVLDDAAIPVDPGVRSACALMGIDPLQVANEGRLLVFLPEADAARAVTSLQAVPGGEGAVRIGAVVADHPGIVAARTAIGGTRIIDLPLGELLPRIC